jgi:ElaB/YqjD/DUF883 family membrane-anchored ribosome-binding protein
MDHTENSNGSALPDQMSALHDHAEEQIRAAREAFTDLDKKVRTFVKERPGLCLLGAVAAGFVIGRIVSRR